MANTCGFISATFTGLHEAGSISVPGVKAGDRVFWLLGHLPGPVLSLGASSFELIISVDDEIQQTSPSELDANTYELIVYRGF